MFLGSRSFKNTNKSKILFFFFSVTDAGPVAAAYVAIAIPNIQQGGGGGEIHGILLKKKTFNNE